MIWKTSVTRVRHIVALRELRVPTEPETTAIDTTVSATHSPEEIAEGSALVEEMLNAWAEATANVDASEDVPMLDGDAAALPEAIAREYVPLKQCFEQYRERLEANAWVRDVVLACLSPSPTPPPDQQNADRCRPYKIDTFLAFRSVLCCSCRRSLSFNSGDFPLPRRDVVGDRAPCAAPSRRTRVATFSLSALSLFHPPLDQRPLSTAPLAISSLPLSGNSPFFSPFSSWRRFGRGVQQTPFGEPFTTVFSNDHVRRWSSTQLAFSQLPIAPARTNSATRHQEMGEKWSRNRRLSVAFLVFMFCFIASAGVLIAVAQVWRMETPAAGTVNKHTLRALSIGTMDLTSDGFFCLAPQSIAGAYEGSKQLRPCWECLSSCRL